MGQTVGEAVRGAQRRFQAAGVETAGLDAQVLLGHVLGVGRAWIIAHPEASLTPDQELAFERLVQRREARRSVAYLTGQREFYGLDFLVDERVLVPRPETELLVERAVALAHEWRAVHGQWPRVVDVGAGSGAIGVSLAVTVPALPLLDLVDVSPAALEVARANAERHDVAARLRFWVGDLLTPLPEPVDLVLANLPYIETEVIPTLAPEVQQEPQLALDGGPDGLDPFRRLFAQVPHHVTPGGALLLEIGAEQGQAVSELAHVLHPHSVMVHTDLAGLNRLVEVHLRE